MKELYELIEQKIRESGCPLTIDGAEFYDDMNAEADNQENGTYIFIIKKDDKHLFQVDLMVDVSAIASITQRNFFDIHIIYTSLVFIDETVSEQERDKILMVDIPNTAFSSVQEMIKQMTENAGYNSLSIDTIDFEHRFRCNQHIVNEE